MKALWRRFSRRLSPWRHLVTFVLILCLTAVLKYFLTSKTDWIAPQLAAWESAALIHVFFVARKLMQFRGFEFATKKFNLGAKRCVLYVIFAFIILKLIAIAFETQIKRGEDDIAPLATLHEQVSGFKHTIHSIAPYILMMPLFFFFAVNCFARRHVIRQARALGIPDTDQERYLAGLMKFVDAPVVLPFVVMFVYLRFVDRMFEPKIEDLVFGIIGCSLLIVSNLLTGVFDEHWLDVTQNRREHSSGLA